MASRRLIVEILGDDASLQAALGRAGGSVGGFGDRMMVAGKRISSVGKTLTTHLTLPLAAVGYFAGKAAVDFQNSMELLHTQAGVGQKAVESLSKGVLALAGPTATAPDQLSAGLYHLASQGLRGKQSLDALKAAAEGAKLGGADLEDVTNALGATIVAKIGGVNSYSQAMGELNKIVGAGDMRMQDLADAMGTGLPASAKIAGVSLAEIGGALATFGDNNIRGARAGTLLNSTLRIMSAPSSTAQKALASVGIGADELGNKLRSEGLVGALTDLKAKLEAAGMSATQQGVVITRAFGGRQATGVKILLDELDRLKKKTQEVGAGGAQFASDWTAYTKTTAYHLASMGAQMQATGVTIGTILLPVVAKIADFIGTLASKFEALSPGVQKAILIFAGVAAAIGPVLAVLGSITTVIGGVISGFGTLAAAVAPIAAAIGVPVGIAAAAVAALVAGLVLLVAGIAAAVIWPDKLRSVLEKMGLSAHAAGEVVAGLQDVFHVVETAVMALVGVIRDNWTQISAIIGDAVDVIKTVIRADIGIVEALWKAFGGTLTAAAKTVWDFIKATVKNGLEVIHGVMDVITGLIHGDWSKVWKGIEEIVGGTIKQIWNELRTAVSLLGDAVKLIGEAILKGILEPLGHLAMQLLNAIKNAIVGAVKGVVGWASHEASNIGHAITSGITSGIGNIGGGILHSVGGGIMSGLSSVGGLLGIGSPSRVWATKIGVPIAQGIVAGYLEGANALPTKISSSVKSALEKARQEVDKARTGFTASFSNLQSAVDKALGGAVSSATTAAGKQLSAFLASFASPTSGPISDAMTAAGQQLAALQSQHDQQQLQQALTDAQNQVAQAQSQYASDQQSGGQAVSQAQQQLESDQDSGAGAATIQADQTALQQAQQQAQQTLAADKQAITQAQQAVADAQYNIQVASLQQQAAVQAQAANAKAAALQAEATQEAKAATAVKEQKKHEADVALSALKTRLSKEGATQKQSQDAIVKLLKKYGLTYHDVAKDMGEKFAKGLEEGIKLTSKAAEELAGEIAKYLPHSPAEKGPLSQPLGWHNYILGDLGNAVDRVGGVFDGLTALGASGGARAPLSAAAGPPGPAGPQSVTFEVTLNAPNYLGDRHELADTMVTELSKWARRNGNSDLRAVLGAR